MWHHLRSSFTIITYNLNSFIIQATALIPVLDYAETFLPVENGLAYCTTKKSFITSDVRRISCPTRTLTTKTTTWCRFYKTFFYFFYFTLGTNSLQHLSLRIISPGCVFTILHFLLNLRTHIYEKGWSLPEWSTSQPLASLTNIRLF